MRRIGWAICLGIGISGDAAGAAEPVSWPAGLADLSVIGAPGDLSALASGFPDTEPSCRPAGGGETPSCRLFFPGSQHTGSDARGRWGALSRTLDDLLPAPFTVSVGGELSRLWATAAAEPAPRRDETDWRVSAGWAAEWADGWTDQPAIGNVGLSRTWSDRGGGAARMGDGTHLNAGYALRLGAIRASTVAYGGFADGIDLSQPHDGLAGGVAVRADWWQGVSVAVGTEYRDADDETADWRWGAAAEIDPLGLAGVAAGERSGFSLLGRLQAAAAEEAGRPDVRAMVSARLAF